MGTDKVVMRHKRQSFRPLIQTLCQKCQFYFGKNNTLILFTFYTQFLLFLRVGDGLTLPTPAF